MTSKPQRSLLSPTPRLAVPHRGSAASQAPSQHETPAAGAASNMFNPAGQRTPHAPAVPCHRTDPGETADEAALGSDGDNNHLQGGNGVITRQGGCPTDADGTFSGAGPPSPAPAVPLRQARVSPPPWDSTAAPAHRSASDVNQVFEPRSAQDRAGSQL